MTKYTYEFEKIEKLKGYHKKMESLLQKRGDEEWELCHIRDLDESLTCIFKKEK
ncbi:MAG: hypothetical protein O8C64_05225 [Candidatus Methanoperedens sp.]|nr:hypothetical protein [Candidatus Methanoperedens sp.]MCZ7403308.1 hypothetical protein [Candidatus Methanoperedens sp.]